MILLYKYEKVGIKTFSYNKFKIRIWDYFQHFDSVNNEINMRITLFDPNFFMPG